MKKNVGKTDKIIRYLLGIAVIGLGYMYSSWWGAVGLGIMLPAILGSDPLYNVLGLNTNSK